MLLSSIGIDQNDLLVGDDRILDIPGRGLGLCKGGQDTSVVRLVIQRLLVHLNRIGVLFRALVDTPKCDIHVGVGFTRRNCSLDRRNRFVLEFFRRYEIYILFVETLNLRI